MAPKSRANAGAGTKGKAGRRAPVRPKRGAGVPLLPIVVGSILVVLTVAMIGLIVYFQRPTPPPQPVSGISCDQLEHSTAHYHAALQIIYHGVTTNITDNAGIQTNSAGTGVKCYYWLHVHAQDGVIHVEALNQTTYTLGQFFAIWRQSLTTTQVGPVHGAVTAYVNGVRYFGDPAAIPLRSHEDIQLDVGKIVAPKKVDWSQAQL